MYKAIVRYILIAFVGLLVLGMISAIISAFVVKRNIVYAEAMLENGQPRDALARILSVEPRAATRMPKLEHRLLCCAIRCHVRLSEYKKAASLASEVEKRANLMGASIVNIRFLIADVFFSSGIFVSPRQGYDSLLRELRSEGGDETLVSDLLPEDMRTVPKPAARKPPPATTPPVVRNEPRSEPVAPQDSTVVLLDPYSADPHTRLAEKAVVQENWEVALKEADLALAENANNARAKLMKAIAQAKGLVCGVIKSTSAKAYNSALSALPGGVELGTFLEISGFRASHTDILAVSSLLQKDSVISDILIALKDIEIDTRQLNTLTDVEKSSLKQKATLLSRVDKLKNEQAALKAKLNPHAEPYAKATAAFHAYFKKASSLAAQRESATGDSRMQMEDDLRKLRAEGIKAKQEYEATKKKFKEWDDAFQADKYPEVKKLQESISSLENEISSL